MTELELKLSLPDQLANQAKAAGLLTSEAIERLIREAIRKAAAQGLIELGKRLREPGVPQISEAELETELKAVRAELRETGALAPSVVTQIAAGLGNLSERQSTELFSASVTKVVWSGTGIALTVDLRVLHEHACEAGLPRDNEHTDFQRSNQSGPKLTATS